MNEDLQRLELAWVGKGRRHRLEPRILLESRQFGYHANTRQSEDDQFENRLVFGDNLLALKALEVEFGSRIKCIYIDPPYNTGAAYSHFEDGLEHSVWLSLMRDRLELLRRLLRPDGVIFAHIDDNEHAYLKVLMDEIFGRKNFCGEFIWEKKKKPSFLDANLGVVTEYILAFARDRAESPPFVAGRTTAGKKYPLNNAGNGLRILTFPPGAVQFSVGEARYGPQDMSGGNIITRLLDPVVVRSGRNVGSFRLEGEWRYAQKKVDEIVAAGDTLYISKVPFRPNHIRVGGEAKKMKNLLSIAHYQVPTYEDSSAESEALFGENAFDYPKPEGLLSLLVGAVTEPGDWVLDSFAGSGTTGAVAHKLGRKWIMVELGEHCHTHIIPRMKKVIDGADLGGITREADWKGGGGFRYYRLAPSLLEKDGWGNWVINKEYNAAMLAEAVCKIEGFTYAPSETEYWQHGRSTEQDFIWVTTQTLSVDQLQKLSDEVGPERSLLICCGAFRAKDLAQFPNLTVKKIPKAVLNRCEWGKDDYSLAIQNLPQAPEPESDVPPEEEKVRSGKSTTRLPLFDEEGE